MQRVYIGIGSNLDEPIEQIKSAVQSLRLLPESHYLSDSGLYLSKAMQLAGDCSEQPDYYNAVALLETSLQPLVLLDLLQAIENKQGRVRTGRWAPRTLDLDILLFGDLQTESERLQIPHPGLCEREFVLYPMQRIDEDVLIPGHGKLADCMLRCSQNGLRYIGSIGGI